MILTHIDILILLANHDGNTIFKQPDYHGNLLLVHAALDLVEHHYIKGLVPMATGEHERLVVSGVLLHKFLLLDTELL